MTWPIRNPRRLIQAKRLGAGAVDAHSMLLPQTIRIMDSHFFATMDSDVEAMLAYIGTKQEGLARSVAALVVRAQQAGLIDQDNQPPNGMLNSTLTQVIRLKLMLMMRTIIILGMRCDVSTWESTERVFSTVRRLLPTNYDSVWVVVPGDGYGT